MFAICQAAFKTINRFGCWPGNSLPVAAFCAHGLPLPHAHQLRPSLRGFQLSSQSVSSAVPFSNRSPETSRTAILLGAADFWICRFNLIAVMILLCTEGNKLIGDMGKFLCSGYPAF
jgi:hypothetical protein